MGDYVRPAGLDEALEHLARRPYAVVAGATDLYPAHVGRSLQGHLLDISGILTLRGIVRHDDHWRIGATTTWSDLIAADLPPLFDGLKQAAREIGGRQIQNAGTLGGNICNASPAADGVPPLLALDAEVELASVDGMVRLPLAAFVNRSRSTARKRGQLLTGILVPQPALPCRSAFAKLGARRYLVISIASVAAMIEIDCGLVSRARVAVGACSPVPCRLPELEAALRGAVLDKRLGDCVTESHLAALAPIDDIRADASYRRAAVTVMVRRILNQLGPA